jgi:hypothetical protein
MSWSYKEPEFSKFKREFLEDVRDSVQQLNIMTCIDLGACTETEKQNYTCPMEDIYWVYLTTPIRIEDIPFELFINKAILKYFIVDRVDVLQI